MADFDRAREEVHNAIFEIINEEAGAAMVTKWVCLVEVVEEDGTKAMWSMGSEDLSIWDRIGMLEFHSRGLRPESRLRPE